MPHLPQPVRDPRPRTARTAAPPRARRLPSGGRAFVLTLLLALLLTLAGCQSATPPVTGTPPGVPSEPTPTTASWSDPAAWPGGRVPAPGDDVTIPVGSAVLLDVSPPQLGALQIDGTLVFGPTDIDLHVDRIRVRGHLEIGTPQQPFEQRAQITLHGGDDPSIDQELRRGFVIDGSAVLAGVERLSWTRLGATLEVGERALTLERVPDWQPGDRIVVASTDFDWQQTETFTVDRVAGRTVHLTEPAQWSHYGELQSYAGRELDQRAEVALLSRSITVAGADDAAWRDDGFGAHLMVRHRGGLYVSGTEFVRSGQRGRLARYPIHWHLTAERSAGSYLRDVSIHQSANRCVTIHGTSGVTVERVVAHDALGHCFFLEDAAETDNVLRDNLALSVQRPSEADALLFSDTVFPGPASFWITNPDNELVGNVAAGGDGTGFWYALPEHPTGPSYRDDVWPAQTPLAAFRDNLAHSMGIDGLHVDRGPSADLSGLEVTNYVARQLPGDPDSAVVTVTFENFTAYKNRHRGIWLRGRQHIVDSALLADNLIGATFASDATVLTDSLVVAESANLGTPMGSWEWRGAGERSLPRPWGREGATLAPRGFEFYDGTVRVEDSTFVGYRPAQVHHGAETASRDAGALSQLDFTDFVVSPQNAARGLEFIDTVRVHFEHRSVPTQPGASEDGYRSTVFLDEDGSVSGSAGAAITVDNPILLDDGCSERPSWGAWVCSGIRYGQLILDDVSGAGLAPLRIERSDGAEHIMLGMPGGFTDFATAAPLGRSYAYHPGATLGSRVRLHLRHVEAGDRITVSLPWSSGSLSAYRDWWIDDRNRLTRYDTLGALTNANDAGYHLGGGRVTIKLVVQDERDYATVDVCAAQLCGQ